MTVTVGAGAIGAVYLGATPAEKMYVGTELVWSAGPPPPPAGMSAWWDVADLAGLADSAPVTSWVDSSPNGNDLTSAGTTPTWDATSQRVAFSGGRLKRSNPTSMPTTGYTVIARFERTGGSGSGFMVNLDALVGGFFLSSDSTVRTRIGNLHMQQVVMANTAASHIAWGRWNGTTAEVGIDTTVAGGTIPTGMNPPNAANGVSLGARPDGSLSFTGNLGSVLIYPTALNPTDLAAAIAAVS